MDCKADMNREGVTSNPGLRVLALIIILASLACIALAFPAKAYADLKVWVGYAGGPYYEKAYFTDAELWAMADNAVYEYYSVDNGGFFRKGYAQGVKLDVLLNNAGVNPVEMFRFHMSTADGYVQDDGGYGENGTAWYYNELCGKARYGYTGFIDTVRFDDTGRVEVDTSQLDYLWDTAYQVPSIFALRSSFGKITSLNDSRWTDNYTWTSQGYRLMYGQTAPMEGNARDSAHSIRSITCIIGGSDGQKLPTIEMGAEEISGKVGDSFVITPSLTNVGDQLVADLGVYDIDWTTTDPSVLQVRKNADGTVTITIVGEGSAMLGASFGNSPLQEFIGKGSMGVSGKPGSGSGDEGDGKGDEGDEGDGNTNSGGSAKNIKLTSGTQMFAATLQSSASEGAGSGEDSAQGGGDNGADGEGETLSTETVLNPAISVTVEPEEKVYELMFDEPTPLASPESESSDPVRVLVGGGALAVLGGLMRTGRFAAALDRAVSVD